MNGMTTSPPRWWRGLAVSAVVLGVALSPLFFIVLFVTVRDLLAPSMGSLAWTVPVATEGGFVLLFVFGVLLEAVHRPLKALRATAYLFFAASLILNVLASRGNVPAIVGHAALVAAFFLPIIVAEVIVRRLCEDEDAAKARNEMAAAMRHARDLVRSEKGLAWRWRIPSLLRVQILRSRPPAAVTDAVTDGARFGGAAKWESAVETWVRDGLTKRERMRVTVERERRQIRASGEASPEASAQAPRARQAPVRRSASGRVKAARLLTAHPDMPRAEVARKAGVSESTVDRVKRDGAVLAGFNGHARG